MARVGEIIAPADSGAGRQRSVMRWLARAIFAGLMVTSIALGAWAQSQNAGLRFMSTQVAGDAMRMAVWHPTHAKEQGVVLGPFRLKVSQDVPVAPGRFGLIVLSHGAGGGMLNHRGTARALARAGYIVIAVHHPGDNWQDQSRLGTSANWSRRPNHLRAAIDAALNDKTLAAGIDPRRIGAIGYSAGGYTVLAAAGARPGLSVLVQHCREKKAADPVFCRYGRAQREADRQAGRKVLPLKVIPDPRLGAVVAIAPVGALFAPTAFAGVSVRIMLVRAGKDRVLRYPHHAERVHRQVGQPHSYVVLPAAGHFTFIEPFPESLRDVAGPAAQDPPGTDRAAVLQRLNRRIVGFLDKALAPDK